MNKRFISGMAALALIFAGSQALPEGVFIGEGIVAGAVTVDSGQCGKTIAWVLDSAGTLTFNGEGAMDDFALDSIPWFEKTNDIKKVVIGDGITSIGNWAFVSCQNLESADVPDSVTSIGDWAFFLCAGLASIDIPEGVTDIGVWAFSGCTSLTSLVIPNSVTSISDYAFNSCENLSEVTIPDTVTSIGRASFYGCKSLENITIPDSVAAIGEFAFSYCTGLKSIVIPAGVTTISEDTFSECANLTSVTISDGVTSIGRWAFHECESLAEIAIPKSVKSIEAKAFLSCPNLKSVTIPKGVESVGEQALGYYQDKVNGGVNKTEGFKIYCYKDTAGQTYAVDNEFDYELIDPDFVITPKVNTESGEAAPDLTKLTVTAFNAAGGIAAEVNADKDGNIRLGDLPEGEYTLRIQLEGFAPRSVSYTAGTPLEDIALCRYGDCDGNGSIDFYDLGRMQQKLCDWEVEYIYPETADTNGDGKYDFSDLGTLQRFLCDWGNVLGVQA